MSDGEEALYGLYDRQIRLFGRSTQDLIEDAKVYITQKAPYFLNRRRRATDIGGEILKNIALLGVKDISVNETTKESFERISANGVEKISEDIKVSIVDAQSQEDNKEIYTLAVYIDQMDDSKESHAGIYVCSRCMSFHDIKKRHECGGYVLGNNAFPNDCLLGAIVVQEWVKRLQGKPYVEEYQLQL